MPSATARSTAGGTQGRLDLEHDPIIEECSKETAKPAHNHRIWGTLLLTEQMGKISISDGICLSHTYRCGNTSYIVAS